MLMLLVWQPLSENYSSVLEMYNLNIQTVVCRPAVLASFGILWNVDARTPLQI